MSQPVDLRSTLNEDIIALAIEVDYRVEHGAESGGHLEYVQRRLNALLSKEYRRLGAVEVWQEGARALAQRRRELQQ